MDLFLTATSSGYRLQPQSALGMLWLQTHFEDTYWPHLAAGQVQVGGSSADLLYQDAADAGLRILRKSALPSPLGELS